MANTLKPAQISTELACLRGELARLRSILGEHATVADLAAENTQLKQALAKEQLRVRKLGARNAELYARLIHERAGRHHA